jgi:hypothetical protein
MKGSFFKLVGSMLVWLAHHIFRPVFGVLIMQRLRKGSLK